MLSEKAIDRINSILKDQTFNYNGELLSTVDCDIDFKIELLGYRNMIRVGTEYPYMRVKIIFTKFKDDVSKLIFRRLEEVGPNHKFTFMKTALSMKYGLENYLSSVLQFFDAENNQNVVIDDIEIQDKFEDDKPITEQKVPRVAIRNVIKDITNILKRKQEGEYNLPYDIGGGDLYEFIGFPDFDVLLEIDFVGMNNIPLGADFHVESSYVIGYNQLQIMIRVLPDRLEKSLFAIVGKLNDDITHELQHLRQENEGRLEDEESAESVKDYFLQPSEIEAQYKGYKRKSKITGVPISDLIDDWFINNGDRFNLTDKDIKTIKSAIMKYPKTRN